MHLNRVERHKCFVYKEQRLVESAAGQPFLEVDVEPRANSRAICSGCGEKRPGYDRLAATVPVRAVLEHRGVLRLRDATGGLPDMWRDRRTGAVERRQGTSHDQLSLVPGPLGQAALVEGDGGCIQHDLGERVSLRKTRGRMGARPPRSLGHRGHRRRCDPAVQPQERPGSSAPRGLPAGSGSTRAPIGP